MAPIQLHHGRGHDLEPGARGSAGAVWLLLQRAYPSRRAQERRADCRPRRAQPGSRGASIAAPFCCERRLVAGGPAAAGSNLCSACDRKERRSQSLDRRRHGIPEEGRSFRWRRPAVLRATRQAGQLSDCGVVVGSQRAREPADRLSALSSRGLGGRSSSPGQSRRARGRRVQD